MTSEIIQLLIAAPIIQGLIGSSLETTKYKVFPFVAPQNEKGPFIVVRKVQTETDASFICAGTLDFARYHVLSFSKNYIQTEEMHIAIRLTLETGTGIFLENDYDGFDKEADMYCHIGIYRSQETR